MQRQELELVGDIGKHSQSQRNYEQDLAELTPELWRLSDCEELVGVITGDDGVGLLFCPLFYSGGIVFD